MILFATETTLDMWLLEDYYYAWQDVESFVRKDGAGSILLFFVVGGDYPSFSSLISLATW